MDHPSGPAAERAHLPDLVLYTRAGCGLCDETRESLLVILARRAATHLPAPTLVERDIADDPAWERAFLVEIPVVELGDRRLTLAVSPAKVERLLAEVLDR
jgi:hypothetical protein